MGGFYPAVHIVYSVAVLLESQRFLNAGVWRALAGSRRSKLVYQRRLGIGRH